MPSRSSQTPIRMTRRRRRSLGAYIRRLENDVDEILRTLEIAQGHVSSLRNQVAFLLSEIKEVEELIRF